MGTFELDKWALKSLYENYKRNRLDVEPEYQRSKAWPDRLKYELVDTVQNEWPKGLIMLNIDQKVDSDGKPLDYYHVVDGQQRLRCLFEYKDGLESWTHPSTKKPDAFMPYGALTETSQERFDEYRVSVALMRDYETDEMLDIFSRLQNSRPLRIGERVKALRSKHKPQLRKIAEHRLFSIANSAHRSRDAHWNLGAVFYKAVYRDNPLERQEFEMVNEFLRDDGQFDDGQACKTLIATNRLMNLVNKVILEAIELDNTFVDKTRSPRLLKWTFVCLTLLDRRYAFAGRETSLARGLLDYHSAREQEDSPEWTAYLNTGRTGRIDTDDVKICLEHLMNRMILAGKLDPKDENRYFTPQQRDKLFKQSGGKCQTCGTEISRTNFHADHIVPYRNGGKTTVSNGQALCPKCNRSKGGNGDLFSAI